MRVGNPSGLVGLTALAVLAAEPEVHAGVEAWRNEVSADPRFVELHAPPSPDADHCLSPPPGSSPRNGQQAAGNGQRAM
jgi:hypothetical protein